MASPVSEPTATRIKLPSISVRKRILADDNEIVRAVVRGLIEARTDLEVCGEAVDGLNAIEKAKELKPDLVLLDFRMPGLSGVEAASIIRKDFPQARIVLFTLYEQSVSKTMTTAVGIDLVLRKGDGLDRLLESIQNLMES
jgi:NarL family two-component system response regulator LiaR